VRANNGLNDIICLAFTPVLTMALQSARRNPVPYLLGLAVASNIGSAATIIGNPVMVESISF
jgi:Na+/H+ antiporter NhaD/arsenite permease-like protein